MAKLRFRRSSWRRRDGEARLEERLRFRRPVPLPEVPFEGVPPEVLDLGRVGEEQAAPVDLGSIVWRPDA